MPIDPNIAMGVKPIDFLGPAGNYLNLARGAQALQQEQAMNPIQQEKARIELGIARDTQAAEIARQQALSGQAVTGAEVAKFNQAGNTQERLQQVFAPLFKLDSFQDVTKDPRAAFKDVMAAKQQAIAAGVPPESVEMYSASLYSRIEEALNRKDPTPVKEWEFRNLFSRGTQAEQRQAFAPTGVPQATFGGVPGSFQATPAGNQFVPSLINQRQPMPAQQMPQEGVQTGGVPLSTGIQQRPVDLSLSETGPANKQGPGVPLMQPAAPAQPQGVTATAMSMRYPQRTLGQAFAPVQGEEEDRALGQKYVSGLIAAQPVMTKARRDLEEVISMADKIEKAAVFDSAGVMGAAERKVKSALGDIDYQKLSKDLANARIATIQAKGGSLDTVGGQELVRISNGDETYSPKVLKSVAQRAYGDVIATELEGRAAATFAQRYGDANHNTFKQLWSKNADSRIFEIMALPKLIQDKSERIKVANEILKNATPKEREEFNRKYQNILRLEQTGSL
jgi:hypothetical protein